MTFRRRSRPCCRRSRARQEKKKAGRRVLPALCFMGMRASASIRKYVTYARAWDQNYCALSTSPSLIEAFVLSTIEGPVLSTIEGLVDGILQVFSCLEPRDLRR